MKRLALAAAVALGMTALTAAPVSAEGGIGCLQILVDGGSWYEYSLCLLNDGPHRLAFVPPPL